MIRSSECLLYIIKQAWENLCQQEPVRNRSAQINCMQYVMNIVEGRH